MECLRHWFALLALDVATVAPAVYLGAAIQLSCLCASAFVDHLLPATDAMIYAVGRYDGALKKRFPNDRVIAVRYGAQTIGFD